MKKVATMGLLLVTVFAAASFAFAQSPPTSTDTAERTLREYVNARLRWAEWKDYSQFITWPDEPGWDCWWVANDHRFDKTIARGNDLVAPVTYARLGLFCADFTFQPEVSNHIVRYRLVRRGTAWKVCGPIPDYPDVSWAALKAWLGKTAANEKEPAERRQQAADAIGRISAVFAAAQNSSTAATPMVKVPDAATAISLAEEALVKVYGKKLIDSERPFTATLADGVWHVSGTLYCRDAKGNVTTGTCLGGTAEANIRQSDGRILRIIHTK